jgi:hypothetical protein
MINPNSHAHDIWKIADFLEIQSIVGRDRAQTLLRSYILCLETAAASLDGAASARRVRETAHDLKSMSGQLGFEALQYFCGSVSLVGDALATEAMVEPMLVLIRASAKTAQTYCAEVASSTFTTGRAA